MGNSAWGWGQAAGVLGGGGSRDHIARVRYAEWLLMCPVSADSAGDLGISGGRGLLRGVGWVGREQG
jgi:hypothetical protein